MLYWLDLSHNNLTTLPDSIVKLTPRNYLDLGYNKLDAANLSDTVISWLDEYDPDWRLTQNVPILYNPNINPLEFSINIKNLSIQFNLTFSGNTNLQIYNMKGRLIETLIDSYKKAGSYAVNWDSKRFCSGIYFLRLSVNGSEVSSKITIIK